MDTLIRVKWPHGKEVNYAELGRLMDKARTTVRRECAGGSSYCLLVMTERMTRRQIIVRLTGRTQKSVIWALDNIERRADNIFRHMGSITCDNGCEFLDIPGIERSALAGGGLRAGLYFAHPYSALERGANENANRIIRRFIPKGSGIGDYTPRQIQEIENWMNRLHRESLKGKTATEAEREELNKLVA